MAAIVWADVTAFAPSLTTVDPAAQADILAHVNNILAVDNFDGESGPTTRLARIYLAAHLATVGVAGAGGTSGPVIERQVGRVIERFALAIAGGAGSGLTETSWGKLYRGLIMSSPARAMVVL